MERYNIVLVFYDGFIQISLCMCTVGDLLKRFQPVVLEDVYPARVAADGNCLYRAISKVICGNEALFILLRIFTCFMIVITRDLWI